MFFAIQAHPDIVTLEDGLYFSFVQQELVAALINNLHLQFHLVHNIFVLKKLIELAQSEPQCLSVFLAHQFELSNDLAAVLVLQLS